MHFDCNSYDIPNLHVFQVDCWHTLHIIMTGLRELCWSCPSGTITDGEATYGKEAEVCKEGGMFSCNFKEL